MMRNLKLLLSLVILFHASCSSRAEEPSNPNPAGRPGNESYAIFMKGTWRIENVTLVESNAPSVVPPREGALVSLGDTQILSADGVSLLQADIESSLASPLVWYENFMEDNQPSNSPPAATDFIFGYGYDHLGQGGDQMDIGIKGTSIVPARMTSSHEIIVETAARFREMIDGPVFVWRFRYRLKRADSTLHLGPSESVSPVEALAGSLDW